MTCSKKIRESYGDDVETFSKRLNTLPITVESWESGREPKGVAKLLLNYADNFALSLYPRISEDFAKLDPRSQLDTLLENFGENQKQFAKRIGLPEQTIGRWKRLNVISPMAQRYLYEIAMYPERFQLKQKSYKE